MARKFCTVSRAKATDERSLNESGDKMQNASIRGHWSGKCAAAKPLVKD